MTYHICSECGMKVLWNQRYSVVEEYIEGKLVERRAGHYFCATRRRNG